MSQVQNERLYEWEKMIVMIVKMVKMVNWHAWWEAKAKEAVSDEAREVPWVAHSVDEVQRTEKSDTAAGVIAHMHHFEARNHKGHGLNCPSHKLMTCFKGCCDTYTRREHGKSLIFYVDW